MVTIIHSNELVEMKLDKLIGQQANVLQVCYDKKGNIRGAWVEWEEPFLEEFDWYIPIASLKD